MTLSDVTENVPVRITHLREDSPGLDRFVDMGFLPGTIVRKVGQAPLGDPLVFMVRGLRIAMRRFDAGCVHVEPLGNS